MLIPSSFALPPVEYCRGTSPSHAAKSRPLRNAAPFPMAATRAVATMGPMPGICRMRQQPASLEAICSSRSVSSSICCSTVFHSLREVQVLAERWRVHYNTIRPHSSLGYKSPAPETWQPEVKTGYGEVESKVRFPLPHTLDGDEILTKINALH